MSTRSVILTLVVAKKSGNDLFIVADSKLNDPKAIERNPMNSILKVAILHPLITIAYAGVVHYAEKVVSDFYSKNICDLKELFPLLMNAHVESNQQTDFILATALGGHPQLFLIKNGNLEHNIENAWIGEAKAFSVYQESFHSLDDGVELKERMKSALDSVCTSDFVDSVGWYTTCALLDFKEHTHPIFLYDMETVAVSGDKLTVKAGETIALSYGQAETGSYSISTLFSRSLARPAIGRYFEQVQLGILHCPRISLYPILFRNCSGEEFIIRAFKENSVPLKGVIIEQGTMFRLVDALVLTSKN